MSGGVPEGTCGELSRWKSLTPRRGNDKEIMGNKEMSLPVIETHCPFSTYSLVLQ